MTLAENDGDDSGEPKQKLVADWKKFKVIQYER